jgi:hypothetical protein
MSHPSPLRRLPQPTRRQVLLGAASLGATSLLAACGGGGDSADDGSTSAASFTSGPISGFGSVIVGGVRFDDTLALIVDEDGNRATRGDLKLGCVIDIDAGRIDRAEMRAVALRILLGGALVGPVSVVDGTSNTLMLLGQTVLVTTSTVFDAAITGGLPGIMRDNVYEVYGLFDPANNRFVATRIAPKTGATEYRLRGVVSNLDKTARTFNIGSQLVNYAGVPSADVPSTLADGQFVRVLLQTTQVNGAWVAIRLRQSVRTFEPRPDVHLEGVITAWTAPSSTACSWPPRSRWKTAATAGAGCSSSAARWATSTPRPRPLRCAASPSGTAAPWSTATAPRRRWPMASSSR